MDSHSVSLDDVQAEIDRLVEHIGRLDSKDRKKALKTARRKLSESGGSGKDNDKDDDDNDDDEGLDDLTDGVSELF